MISGKATKKTLKWLEKLVHSASESSFDSCAFFDLDPVPRKFIMGKDQSDFDHLSAILTGDERTKFEALFKPLWTKILRLVLQCHSCAHPISKQVTKLLGKYGIDSNQPVIDGCRFTQVTTYHPSAMYNYHRCCQLQWIKWSNAIFQLLGVRPVVPSITANGTHWDEIHESL